MWLTQAYNCIAGVAAVRPSRNLSGPGHDGHIVRDELNLTDTGIKSFGREVDQLLARGDLHIDLGVSLRERGSGSSRIGTTAGGTERRNSPAGRCPKSRAAALAATSSSKAGFARERNRSPDSVKPTLRVARMKSAEPTCASSARTAWLIADGVTPSSAARSAKTAVLGDTQERLDAVERALPRCEVLLHGLSMLSRRVANRKRS
jgi:hypothetical protein